MLHVTVEASQNLSVEGVEARFRKRFYRSRGPTRRIKPFGGRSQIDLDGLGWSGRGCSQDAIEGARSIAVLAKPRKRKPIKRGHV